MFSFWVTCAASIPFRPSLVLSPNSVRPCITLSIFIEIYLSFISLPNLAIHLVIHENLSVNLNNLNYLVVAITQSVYYLISVCLSIDLSM